MKRLLILSILLLSIHTTYAQVDTMALRIAADTAVEHGDYKIALENYYQILDVDTTRDDIFGAAGACLFARGEYKSALSFLTFAIKLDDADYYHYYTRGIMLEQLKVYDLAVEDFAKALQLMPTTDAHDTDRIEVNLYLGSSYLSVRNFDSALLFVNAALAIDSNYINAVNNKINVLIEMKALDEVPALLSRLDRLAGESTMPMYVRTWYYVNVGDYEEAVKTANELLKIEPTPHGVIYSNLSFAHYKLGDMKTAMKNANLAVDRQPDNSYAYKNRALIHIANGDMDDACKDLKEAETLGYKDMYGNEVQELILEHCNKM